MHSENMPEGEEANSTATAFHAGRQAALALAQTVREMSQLRHDGAPFTDIAADLERLREARDLEISGEAPLDHGQG